jgi:predicted Zn-dependent protease
MRDRDSRAGAVPGYIVAIGLAVLAGCSPVAGPGGGGEGPGHRSQPLALTPEQEYRIGVRAWQEVLAEAKKNNAIVTDPRAVARVRGVGQRIADVATGNSQASRLLRREINLHTEGYRYDWEFAVLASNQANAFCLPAGKVAVFTGMLRFIDRNFDRPDDALATVLGHEIAHALAHHASERLSRDQRYTRALDVLDGGGSADDGERRGLRGILAAGSGLGGKAYERAQESEADHVGVFLMTFAGYDPAASVRFWEGMAGRGGGQLPEIFSDHPSDARRVAQLRQWAEQARAGKRAFDQGNVVRD